MGKKIDRIGEIGVNNQGCNMKIVGYENSKNIDVLFEDGNCMIKAEYRHFKNGGITNPCFKNKYGLGYFGIGKYNSSLKSYSSWSSMFERCYDELYHVKKPTYKECVVSEEFFCFQNFAEWYEENMWSEDCVCLDKDILYKGNKIYSSESCVLVDNRINSLFTKSDKSRGCLPIGVRKDRSRYQARLSTTNGRIHIGEFGNIEEAFNAYKKEKEKYIKEVADEYFEKYPKFPYKLLQAMYEYEVSIND